MGRNRMIETRFCSICGTVLKYKYYFHHFSTANGFQLYRVKATCPHRKHWWDGHNNYWLNDYDGNRYFYSDGEEEGVL